MVRGGGLEPMGLEQLGLRLGLVRLSSGSGWEHAPDDNWNFDAHTFAKFA